MSLVLITLIIALKFLIPAGLVVLPFWLGWANFVLDTVDGDLLIPLGLQDGTYQPIDKIADWATYVAMVIAAYRGRWSIRRWIYGLFALRSVGQLIFLLSADERVFFVFPNFLEPLFLVYATALFFKKSEKATSAWYAKHQLLILALVFVYKMQDEYITHIGNFDRSDIIRNLFGG